MKMKLIYIIVLISVINSKDYKILDINPYKNIYYANDMFQRKEDILIYKFEPKNEKRNIFLLFLGPSNKDDFEFYLYKAPEEITFDKEKHLINYLEKYINYGEIKINQELDIYYILVRMNSYEDKYDYLSFIIYNTEEYWNIGNLETNQEYLLAFEDDKEITLTYHAKNITQYFHISIKGECEELYYELYKNNTKPDSVTKINHQCNFNHYNTIAFVRDNNYYMNLKFASRKKKILRIVFYFLTNKNDIFEIKDYRTDIKYAYTSYIIGANRGIDIKYYFINTTDLPINQLIGYSIYDPYNSLSYRYWVKRYENYDIEELPNGVEVKDFDYDSYNDINMKNEPLILIRKFEDTKGLFLKIRSYLNEDNDQVNHNEMIVYLKAKYIFEDLTENHIFNHTELKEKNVFYLQHKTGKFIMKSNLDYFTILRPRRERVWSKTYLFEISNIVFELQNSENASVEFQYTKDIIISNLASPYTMFLCNNSIKEEKLLYLPYMTNFNILFGDIIIYDIDVSSLNSLDDFYDEKYMKIYNSDKRYDDYISSKGEISFYKLKCNKYSFIKFENSFNSYVDENITINKESKKLILDFSRYNQKNINFKTNQSLYIGIGILNSQEINENWSFNFYINDEKYSLNNTNNIFFHGFNTNDNLKIEKPDNNNIHPYINVMHNYTIEKFSPLRTNNSGIFVIDKNITEEYNILINITYFYRYYNAESGKYNLFYGDPKNYEYNQLISYPIEISNNPYQYLENNDENKSFFILYENYSSVINEFRLVKLTKKNIQLNDLILIEKSENERVILNLPKINDSTHVFIQYFYEEMELYDNNDIIIRPSNNYFIGREDNMKEYKFYNNKEFYASNDNIKSYNTFLSVSYVDIDYYKGNYEYDNKCYFKILYINDTFNDITIEISNRCTSVFHYYIFILYNTSIEYNDMSPLELFYAKKHNDSIKCYEFTTNKSEFEIEDNFLKGPMNITIVGQSVEGFRRFVYDEKEYDYVGKKKSYLVYIILGCIGGALIILIIIIIVVKRIKKRKIDSFNEKKTLLNKAEEKAKKEEIGSADFAYIFNGSTDTPTSTPTPM